MSNTFFGTGNLGDTPTLKVVDVRDGKRPVCEMRVFFDNYKPDGNGGFEQSGGFWLNVSVWGERGERCAKLLRKGSRVRVEGRLEQQNWTDRETNEERVSMILNADDVFMSLVRVDSVNFSEKSSEGQDE